MLQNLGSLAIFQSTHPVRGATRPAAYRLIPREISIHAPREGCDEVSCHFSWHVWVTISIHAPREGCDASVRRALEYAADFNPRTP